MHIFSWVVGAALLSAPLTALGQSTPHVHGVSILNVAVEGKSVTIELVAPGSDIVGFEHEPHDSEDRKIVEAAVAKLKNGARIFGFPKNAGCRIEEAEVESGLMEHDDHDHAKPHQSHDKDHKGADGDAHAEFHAHYHFECARSDAITSINVNFFSMFPRAEELEVRTITPRGQGSMELTPGSTRLTL